MRFFTAAAAAAALLLAPALAEDLLFIDSLEFQEYNEAITTLGMTAKAVSESEWRAMTTADFAKYKAIVIADPSCGSLSDIQFLDDTKTVWSPAVLGNMILIGMCALALLRPGWNRDTWVGWNEMGSTNGAVDI